MSRLVILTCKVKHQASRSESESEQGDKYVGIDAKRDDLPLARLKAA